MKELYRHTKIYDYYDADLKLCNLQHKEKIIGFTQFMSDIDRDDCEHWKRYWKSMHAEIGGQVKNFLVACRTCAAVGDGSVIVVRGSKMEQGGGRWHHYFVTYLLRMITDITVEFYDVAEIRREEEIRVGANRATVRWIDGYYYQEDDSRVITAIVDDVWVVGSGLQYEIPKSEFYSIKGIGKQYMHTSELRHFSHTMDIVVPSPCPCVVCTEVAQLSIDFETYVFLRDQITVLGHPPCVPLMQTSKYMSSDLIMKGKMLRQLLVNPTVAVTTQSELRAAMVVGGEHNIVPISDTVITMQFANPQPLTITRSSYFAMNEEGDFAGNVNERLRGRKVRFMGVDANILKETPITVSSNMYYDDIDVMFCGSVNIAVAAPRCKVLYVPGDRFEVMKILSNYTYTGHSWYGYNEYCYDVGDENADGKIIGVRNSKGKLFESNAFGSGVDELSVFSNYDLIDTIDVGEFRSCVFKDGLWRIGSVLDVESADLIFYHSDRGIFLPEQQGIRDYLLGKISDRKFPTSCPKFNFSRLHFDKECECFKYNAKEKTKNDAVTQDDDNKVLLRSGTSDLLIQDMHKNGRESSNKLGKKKNY